MTTIQDKEFLDSKEIKDNKIEEITPNIKGCENVGTILDIEYNNVKTNIEKTLDNK